MRRLPLALLLLLVPTQAAAQLELRLVSSTDVFSGTSVPNLAFVVKGDGSLHALAEEQGDDELHYLTDASGSWTSEVVAAVSDAGARNVELELGPDDSLHGVFSRPLTVEMGYARLPAGSDTWNVSTIRSGARSLRIAVGGFNLAQTVHSEGTLFFGTNASGPWVFSELAAGGVFAERDPQILIHFGVTTIGYVDRTVFESPRVVLRRGEGGGFTESEISSDGEDPFDLTSDGVRLHALYFRSDPSGAVRPVHAVQMGAVWSETVASVEPPLGSARSPTDLAIVDGAPVFATIDGGLTVIARTAIGFVRATAGDYSTVRLRVDGDRLLLLAATIDGQVRLLEASLADGDVDGAPDAFDRCLEISDPEQEDTDGDGVGDACNDDDDRDGDEFSDSLDNCPDVPNPTQADTDDGDALGDACDCEDTDGVCLAWDGTAGYCDASDEARTDDDCDYTPAGTDAGSMPGTDAGGADAGTDGGSITPPPPPGDDDCSCSAPGTLLRGAMSPIAVFSALLLLRRTRSTRRARRRPRRRHEAAR